VEKTIVEFQSISSLPLGSGRISVYVAFPIIPTSASDIAAFKADEMRLLESLYERSFGCEMTLYGNTLLAHALHAVYRIDRGVTLFWGSEQMRLLGRMPAPQKQKGEKS
jgi:hypothetical protein